ncbi:MAG: hypothetical protein KatS3mg051_1437 [Anaerolineae bacterium]|nr:MAG: hypothetical protein KatS3mg051_1437 [Anaerolineae bacterium]
MSEKMLAYTELEQALLATIMYYPECADAVVGVVNERDFYIQRHGWIWQAIVALRARGDSPDVFAVSAELRRMGKLAETEEPYLTYLLGRPGTPEAVTTYANLLQRASYRRKLVLLAQDIARRAFDEETDEVALQERLEELVRRARQTLPVQSCLARGSLAQEYYENLIRERVEQRVPDVFPVHVNALERYVPPIKPGRLVIVSGLSGHGKTIFMEQWAEWLAMLGHRVLYITTELTAEDHLDRRYVRHTGLPYSNLLQPTENDLNAVVAARSQLGSWQHNIDFWETQGAAQDAVLTQMRRAHQFGVRAFFVDYFWEILADNQHSTVDSAVRALHQLAVSTKSLVVVGSQLTETNDGLRTYGTRRLEQKAALHLRLEPAEKVKVLTTYRVDDRVIEAEPDEPDPMRHLAIVKNTYGPAHVSVRIFLDGERLRFVDEEYVGYGAPRSLAPEATHWTERKAHETDHC